MARRPFTLEELDELRQLAAQWGKSVGRRAFGDDGPGLNGRVKSKQKYGNRPGDAEAILQVPAALLSADGRLERYFADRPGNLYRRRVA